MVVVLIIVEIIHQSVVMEVHVIVVGIDLLKRIIVAIEMQKEVVLKNAAVLRLAIEAATEIEVKIGMKGIAGQIALGKGIERRVEGRGKENVIGIMVEKEKGRIHTVLLKIAIEAKIKGEAINLVIIMTGLRVEEIQSIEVLQVIVIKDIASF
jgi:hypothetical protein